MKYTRGRRLEPGEKYAIVSVKSYFDRNKKEFGLTESSAQLTVDALEIGISTVKRIMADFRRDPSLLDKIPVAKGRPNYAIDGSYEEKKKEKKEKKEKKGSVPNTASSQQLNY